SSEQVVREDLDLRVQFANTAVVEPASGLHLVLGVDQRMLHLKEILARLQLRIGLGDGEEALQRLLQVSLGDSGLTRTGRGESLGPGAGDVLEDGLLVRGVALDRLDEVRNEIGSPL